MARSMPLILRIIHLVYGLTLSVVSCFACFHSSNALYLVAWAGGSDDPSGIKMLPGDVFALQSFAVAVMASGLYCFVAAVLGWTELFYATWAIAQAVIAPSLLFFAQYSPAHAESRALVRLLGLVNYVMAGTTLMVLFLCDRLMKMKSEPPAATCRKSWPQFAHAVYNLALSFAMVFVPGTLQRYSGGGAGGADAELLIRALGVQLLLMVALYGNSARASPEMLPFRTLSVFTRLGATAFLATLAAFGLINVSAFYGCIGDAIFATLTLLDVVAMKWSSHIVKDKKVE